MIHLSVISNSNFSDHRYECASICHGHAAIMHGEGSLGNLFTRFIVGKSYRRVEASVGLIFGISTC